MDNPFTIVFEKLAEVSSEPGTLTNIDRVEMDEIAELRRVVLEITDPEPQSYTIA